MSAAARRARFARPSLPPAARARSIFATRSRERRLSPQQSRSRAAARSFLLIFPQPVTETAHSFDGVTGFAEFFAQAAHVRVHGACVDHTFVTPNLVQQPIAVLHAATALNQGLQQFELQAGEMHLLTVDANFMARGIDRYRPGL